VSTVNGSENVRGQKELLKSFSNCTGSGYLALCVFKYVIISLGADPLCKLCIMELKLSEEGSSDVQRCLCQLCCPLEMQFCKLLFLGCQVV
jgi:hypothetical protein